MINIYELIYNANIMYLIIKLCVWQTKLHFYVFENQDSKKKLRHVGCHALYLYSFYKTVGYFLVGYFYWQEILGTLNSVILNKALVGPLPLA